MHFLRCSKSNFTLVLIAANRFITRTNRHLLFPLPTLPNTRLFCYLGTDTECLVCKGITPDSTVRTLFQISQTLQPSWDISGIANSVVPRAAFQAMGTNNKDGDVTPHILATWQSLETTPNLSNARLFFFH